MSNTTITTKSNGAFFSVTATVLFALMPAYLQWLPPLHDYVVVGQRILWSSIIIALVLLVLRQLGSALQPLADFKTGRG